MAQSIWTVGQDVSKKEAPAHSPGPPWQSVNKPRQRLSVAECPRKSCRKTVKERDDRSTLSRLASRPRRRRHRDSERSREQSPLHVAHQREPCVQRTERRTLRRNSPRSFQEKGAWEPSLERKEGNGLAQPPGPSHLANQQVLCPRRAPRWPVPAAAAELPGQVQAPQVSADSQNGL